MKVFGVTVLFLAVLLSKSDGAKMQAYTMASYDNDAYKVMWKYDMIKDTFTFNVTVNATGWVGFGVSNRTGNMMGYDVMVGGVRGMHMNETYGNDYFTDGHKQPSPDTTKNYMLTSAMEMNGYTNLVFYRKRDTGDAQDVEIKPGMMYLVWAYHYTNDVNATNGSFMKHSKRGIVKYEYIAAKYTIVTINANYRLYWAYDKNTDMFYFTVVVKATGWVAFGVSNNFGNMNGYDVMIGGVDGSGNGYAGDYLTGGRSKPPKDAEQNWNLTAYEQREGYTMLTVHRKRNTGDSKDVEIKPGEMYIVWAYHATGDVANNDDFSRHTARGGMKYTFMQDTNGGGNGNGDGNGDGDGDGGKGSSAMYYPSIFGIIALLLFQFVMCV